MNVSGAAVFPNALASLATERQAAGVQAEIALDVLKQVQAAQQGQAEALIRMIQQSAPAARPASPNVVDVYA
jgi:hypothetical protein